MDKYLAQLYDTMEGLSNNQLRYSHEAYQPKDFLEHIELFEQWSDSSSINIADYSELSIDHLPPHDLLDDAQIRLLYSHLFKFLKAYSVNISLPISLSLRDKYKIVRRTWPEFEIGPGTSGYIFDFCSGDSEGCNMEEFCQCKDLENRPITNQDDQIDHFYTLDNTKDYPLLGDSEYDGSEQEIEDEEWEDEDYLDDIQLDYEAMWKDYEPLNFVTSKYIPQLVQDLKESALHINPTGTIEVLNDDEMAADHLDLKYQTLYSVFLKDEIDFPAWVEVNIHEADAISKTLMDIFNNAFFNETLPFQDPYTRYKALKQYLSSDVALIEPHTYILRPFTPEERANAIKTTNQFMDSIFTNLLDNIDDEDYNNEDDDEERDDECPF